MDLKRIVLEHRISDILNDNHFICKQLGWTLKEIAPEVVDLLYIIDDVEKFGEKLYETAVKELEWASSREDMKQSDLKIMAKAGITKPEDFRPNKLSKELRKEWSEEYAKCHKPQDFMKGWAGEKKDYMLLGKKIFRLKILI